MSVSYPDTSARPENIPKLLQVSLHAGFERSVEQRVPQISLVRDLSQKYLAKAFLQGTVKRPSVFEIACLCLKAVHISCWGGWLPEKETHPLASKERIPPSAPAHVAGLFPRPGEVVALPEDVPASERQSGSRRARSRGWNSLDTNLTPGVWEHSGFLPTHFCDTFGNPLF